MLRIAASVLLIVGLSFGQFLYRETLGENLGDFFGSSVAGTGDLNGDGVSDYLVAAVATDYGGANGGSVSALSGSDGTLIWRADGPAGAELGDSLDAARDVTGDGVRDVVVSSSTGGGRVHVFSGADGSLLFFRTNVGVLAAYSSIFLDDVDGDGVPDILAGLQVLSGANGTTIRFLPFGSPTNTSANTGKRAALLDDWTGDGIGEVALGKSSMMVVDPTNDAILFQGVGDSNALCAAPDVDGDGRREVFFVGFPMPTGSPPFSFAMLLGSNTRSIIWDTPAIFGYDPAAPPAGYAPVALTACQGPDYDDDGVPDLLLGMPEWGFIASNYLEPRSGLVGMVSSSSGRFLGWFSGAPNDYAGVKMASIGDVDLDGRNDILLGSFLGNGTRGRISVLNSQPLLNTLASDAFWVGPDRTTWNDFVISFPDRLATGPDEAATRTRLGAEMSLRIAGPPNRTGVLIMDLAPMARQSFQGLELLPDLSRASQWSLTWFSTPPSGAIDFRFSIPNDPNLVGLPAIVQAVMSDPNGSNLTFSNGIQAVIGN